MRNSIRCASFLVLLIPVLAVGAPGLTPHKARYDVSISFLKGTLEAEVTEAEPGFMANSTIEARGMARLVARGVIQESSYFLLDGGGVKPEQYRSIDTLSSEHEIVSLEFDWRERLVRGVVNDREFNSRLEGRVHDRLSIQYELMLDLLGGGAAEEYRMLDGPELKRLEVRNIGRRTLDVPFGRFDVVGIQHNKKDSSRVTTLWCAKALDYLPVIIEQHRDGKLQVRAVLTSYEATTIAPLASSED